MTLDIGNSAPASAAFLPGHSPFTVKGTFWMSVRTYAEEAVPGGLDAVRQWLSPPVQDFFGQLFIASGWYDVWPMLEVSRATSAASGLPYLEGVKRSASYHGERDLNGVYKPMLKQSTPLAVCRRFAGIHSQIYGFGRAEILREEEHLVESCARGMPEPLAAWWTHATEYYLQPILRAAGGKNSKMIWLPPQPDGERAGVPLVVLASHTVWE